MREKLPRLYGQEQLAGDAIAYVKYFTPDSSWTWYATYAEHVENGTYFGFVVDICPECGRFSIAELAAAGPMVWELDKSAIELIYTEVGYPSARQVQKIACSTYQTIAFHGLPQNTFHAGPSGPLDAPRKYWHFVTPDATPIAEVVAGSCSSTAAGSARPVILSAPGS